MIKEILFKLITSKILTKVYHRGCGGHVGYVAEINKSKRDASNFYFLDGSNPKDCDLISIPCKRCEKSVKHLGDMVLINQLTSD